MPSNNSHLTPSRRAPGGSNVVTLSQVPPSQQDPNVTKEPVVAPPRERGGMTITVGKIRISGKMMGGAMPIGSKMTIDGSFVVGTYDPGNSMAEYLTASGSPQANASSQTVKPDETDEEDTGDVIEVQDVVYEDTAKFVNVYAPVGTATHVKGHFIVGRA